MSEEIKDDQWFRQGSDDGLCGFYATLNAVWSLVPNFYEKDELKPYSGFGKRARHRLFFDEAINLLSRVGGTSITTLQGLSGGIDQYQVEELIGRMARYWRQPIVPVLLQDMRDDRTMSDRLKIEDERGKFALVASVMKAGHWVTICKLDGQFRAIDPDALTAGNHPLVSQSRAYVPDPKGGVLIRFGADAS